MQEYGNASGRSGVIGYDINKNGIIVYFKDGERQTYTYSNSGQRSVQNMQQLAQSGQGLNGYLNRNAQGENDEDVAEDDDQQEDNY